MYEWSLVCIHIMLDTQTYHINSHGIDHNKADPHLHAMLVLSVVLSTYQCTPYGHLVDVLHHECAHTGSSRLQVTGEM